MSEDRFDIRGEEAYPDLLGVLEDWCFDWDICEHPEQLAKHAADYIYRELLNKNIPQEQE